MQRSRRSFGIGVSFVVLTVATIVVDCGAYFASLTYCRRENAPHQPYACAAVDQHPGLSLVVALTLPVFVAGASMSARGTRRLWIGSLAVALAWAAYAFSVFTT